ncbi:MAG TPA: carboxylate--amine ligase [Desulfobacteraceae bacterium]|nr:carboxylate--amine ligase [Desulfobacteraceae bacterium]
MNIIKKAFREGRTALTEYESKQVLASYNIPVTNEIIVDSIEDLAKAVEKIDYPLVLKGCSSEITHKTEKDLIRIDIRDEKEAVNSFQEIAANMNGDTKTILVQEMIKGKRELVVGMNRDPQFGPCIMFGLGGIFTEILKDVSFRIAPIEKKDALEMMKEIKGHKILDAVRGMSTVDLEILTEILIKVGQIGLDNEEISQIDINPLIICKGKPVAVDALIILEDQS